MEAKTLSPYKWIADAPVDIFIRPADVPGTAASVRTALHRAVADNLLAPVSQGLYFKGYRSRYGVALPAIETRALETFGKTGSGPSGFSAARALGLTTQLPLEFELATTTISKKTVRGVSVVHRSNLKRMKLSYLEIAVLEVLRDLNTVDHGWASLVKSVQNLIAKGDLRFKLLSEAVATEHVAIVRKRFDDLAKVVAA